MKKETINTPKQGEFITLLALMMAMVALSIDAMLPVLPEIGRDFNLTNPNDQQMIITFVFLGLSIGQLVYGPLSDHLGRKPTIHIANSIFAFGSVLSILSTTFELMLFGRLLQGIGIAGPRIVCLAILRDVYSGREMARIMSFIMTIFIIVPMIAPALGQGIAWLSHWRAIFIFIFIFGSFTWIWFTVRQPETLPVEKRRHLSIHELKSGLSDIFKSHVTIGYALISGIMLGNFVTYLSIAPQIFLDIYDITTLFSLYFAMFALMYGSASFLNAQLVIRFGMQRICAVALISLTILSILFSVIAYSADGQPPFWISMSFFMTTFLCIGLLSANSTTIALEPMGHIAGLASSVIGSMASFISVVIALSLGSSFDGSVLPLALGFAAMGSLALLIMWIVENRSAAEMRNDSCS